MKLKDKVVLITGASRGIGRGIAIEAAREGADVVVNYRSHEAEAEEVAGQVRALGRRAVACRADVADRAEVDAMCAQAADELGGIDACVANAGTTRRGPFLELTAQEMAATIDVSLMGAFHTGQAAAQRMVERGRGGSILVVSSVHAFIPFAGCVPYNTCKAALGGLAFTMAEELAAHRIRVNIIEPGWIDTPGEREMVDDREMARRGARLPWGRIGREEDVAKAAAFLLSDEADYVTAASLRVDGGFWLPSRSTQSL
jgi:glucose 1-dehydrogenase